MGGLDFDSLCEFALGFLMTGRGDARRLAVELVRGCPELAVLEIVLVLSSAAAGLEATFSNREAREMAMDAWRMASVLAVDVHLSGCRRAGELWAWWQSEDDFFLRPSG